MPNCHDDPSVEKAVDVLLEQLKKNPPQKPAMPAGLERSKRIEKVIRRP